MYRPALMLSLLGRSGARVIRHLTNLKNFDPASARSIPSLQHIACPPEGEGYHCFSSQVWHGTRSPTPPDVSIPLRNWQNDTVGDFILPGSIFNVPVRKDILQRVVRWQMAKRQQGTHKTKTRSEVRGGGRKPHPQKGTGQARSGSIRAAQAKASEGRLTVLDTLALEGFKTRDLDERLDVLYKDSPRRSILMIDSAKDGVDGG
ncbi:hypothetical protein CVIRNUC_001443 [Coccomyxa viridis]|uniref:Large ribosomal subunit protein uL4m n=1 Tax=Coccomyxa viridis TaxID=1274662 RepID=A0AAV1HT24_9CHLO|nr:hypothetical protein CVIRNUC_001443 [Coccomyxa viridis]